ncbi:hypothetical protein LZK98_16150 [Sphingomonas cannabina]|uniref:hypothetical protein n=1 Tax=Sphingomonas cannabina TaxID=2899123 RepID=UPI001F302E63|nr:hypothetical protein [Sphingomonas cannabina]UIJ44576.1 hypothetical protein LZK98_16150 [Sphingomonas cannabina]
MSERPDLGDPAELARYRHELRMVARGTRLSGIALALLGVLAAILRGSVLPSLPEVVPLALIVTALGLMLIGTWRRVRYHMQRMRRL